MNDYNNLIDENDKLRKENENLKNGNENGIKKEEPQITDTEYGKLNENIINLMQGAKEFLQDKFELVDNEVFLSFSKEISEANITNDFLQKILMVARNVEYISIIPMFEENGKDVKSLRFLMGYEKRVK